MDMSTKLDDLDNSIVYRIREYAEFFNRFKHVFLFGSILESNRVSNDIDVLVIYEEYSYKIMDDL